MVSLNSIAVLIPAWRPEVALRDLVAGLQTAGFGAIVVVDDGSPAEKQAVFAQLREAGATVLRHAVNLGKGRALKTGFNQLLVEHPQLIGVVTADADGQHALEDIVRVAEALADHGGEAVLGVRNLDGESVPWRSRLGNRLTRRLFHALTGVPVADTQTGLRGFPMEMLPTLMTLPGERYEYEITVLAHLCRKGQQPREVPIRTLYFERNAHSHFDPVRDSARIYLALARSR